MPPCESIIVIRAVATSAWKVPREIVFGVDRLEGFEADRDRTWRKRGLLELAPGIHHDFGVLPGIGKLGERALYPVETKMAGDQRRAVNLALGDVMQALCELLRRVAEHELQIKLLGDSEEWFKAVDLHAHADHDDAGPSRRAVHDLLDDSRHAHAFEDYRRTLLRAPSHELSIAAAVVAFRRCRIVPGLVRRALGRIDHDVCPHAKRQRAARRRIVGS